MNFQERFKGKTSQMSKDPISSITDTSDKMRVDFNNMKPCDVYEITRSYTPKVKSETGGPARNSSDFQSLYTTDKGLFRRPSKNISSISFQKQDNQNSFGNDTLTSQGIPVFSSLQNNFDSYDTTTDISSPVNNKKTTFLKQKEKSKFLDSPVIVKDVNSQYTTVDKAFNTPTKMQVSERSIFLQKAQMQNPQQVLQSRLAKERSQSNNFQRVGSYLTQPTPSQADQFKKSETEQIINFESTPQAKNKRIQTETGETNKNFSMFNCLQNQKSVQSTSRSNNIEDNELNYNHQRRMTEQIYSQNNQNRISSTIDKEQFIGTPSRLTHSISKQIIQPKTSQLAQQNQQDEYYSQNNFGGPFDKDQQQAYGSNNRTNRSNNGLQDSKIKLKSVQDEKQQDAIDDLEQFINGLNRNPQSQSSTFLQTNNSMNNNSRIMQSQQLWMNTQLQKIVPVDSLQNQINQLQTKKEEEEALMAYKHQFNYKSRLVGRLTGNDSPALSSQGVDSPSLRQSKQLENFQQVSEVVTNNMLQSNLMSNTNQSNTPMNLGSLRQKSYSSQQFNQNQPQRMVLNIK